MSIRFFSEGISFKPPNPRKTISWIKFCLEKEKKEASYINYIFCSDSHLLKMNQKYLNHDTLTDIVSFQYSSYPIEGEIYISVDRVKENCKLFNRPFKEELCRVIIHGVLHFVGYKDKTPSQKAQMRKKEEAYLSLRT